MDWKQRANWDEKTEAERREEYGEWCRELEHLLHVREFHEDSDDEALVFVSEAINEMEAELDIVEDEPRKVPKSGRAPASGD